MIPLTLLYFMIPDPDFGKYILTRPEHVVETCPVDDVEWHHKRRSCKMYAKLILTDIQMYFYFEDRDSFNRDCTYVKSRLVQMGTFPPDWHCIYFDKIKTTQDFLLNDEYSTYLKALLPLACHQERERIHYNLRLNEFNKDTLWLIEDTKSTSQYVRRKALKELSCRLRPTPSN